jgi:hypothetical protein
MRRTTIGMLGAVGLAASGCGSGSSFANKPRPATPVDLTVYVNDARVSVSPNSVGAGPVIFIVTNQASHAESIQIQATGSGSQPLADTGRINPQATSEVTVNFDAPGDYTVATGSGGSSDAAQATTTPIHPATLHIGHPRKSAKDVLLQP